MWIADRGHSEGKTTVKEAAKEGYEAWKNGEAGLSKK